MPISIRIGSNRPEVIYEELARRLAEITQKELLSEAIKTADGFLYAVRDFLDGIGERRILVVVDGLDEALENSFNPAIFPTPMPSNLRVLLSARWQVRLGWDRGVKVNSFELEPLTDTGIADVLVKLGARVDILGHDRNLVTRLKELTEGEPLLVKCYTEDMWGKSVKGIRISRADLDHLEPGFDSYFQRWFDKQNELWAKEEIDREEVDKGLSLLAFAQGRLQDDDLVALMEHVHDKKGVFAADRLLVPLSRWVFGSGSKGSGYILSHPKIGEYLQQTRFAAFDEELRRGFASWCLAHIGDVNDIAVCVSALGGDQRDARELHDICGGRVASSVGAFEGGQRGFASAVQKAWDAQRKDKSNLRLGAQ